MLKYLENMLLQKQTYSNVLYLLLALPLGIAYLCVILVGFTLSLLSIFLIGIPLLILFVATLWKLAAFERKQAISWLQIDIPPLAKPLPAKMRWTQRFQLHMSRAETWKSLLYLFLKFPFGILAFCLAITVLSLILSLSITSFILGFLLAPFIYVYHVLRIGGTDGRAVRRYLLLSATGYGMVIAPLQLLNVLALLWGQFARTMLGMSDKNLRLAQVTALAEQERAKAERAEKSRSELIVNVSHELRTPVASIRGHIESLLIACDESETGVPAQENLRRYLTIVHRESLHLGALVDDLLAVARAETNELRVNMTQVAADEVVEEVYQTLMPLAKRERQILLIREVAQALPRVQADRQRLLQVLLNLVRNAITYTPDGGIVSIALGYADGEYLALSVSDTGIGISAEDRERIFERFYRSDASRTRGSGGSGLGLAIVRDFVIAMGGSVSVKSGVGEGSCFRVLLRIAAVATGVSSVRS